MVLAEFLVCKQVEVQDAAQLVRFSVSPAVQRESLIDHRPSLNFRGAFAGRKTKVVLLSVKPRKCGFGRGSCVQAS